MGVRRDVFDALGGFAESPPGVSSSDVEWAWRAHCAGFEIGYAAEAAITKARRPDSRSAWRQWSGYGRGARWIVRIHPGSLARQLTRAVHRSWTARQWLDDADVVIGADAATAQLLWTRARRRPDVPHIVGLDSALTRTSG